MTLNALRDPDRSTLIGAIRAGADWLRRQAQKDPEKEKWRLQRQALY
jgi:hypothetical protein